MYVISVMIIRNQLYSHVEQVVELAGLAQLHALLALPVYFTVRTTRNVFLVDKHHQLPQQRQQSPLLLPLPPNRQHQFLELKQRQLSLHALRCQAPYPLKAMLN
jgi:hypothetical protein